MKILVTGAFGYIGMALLERLAEHPGHHRVIAFGRVVSPRPLPRCEVVEGDVTRWQDLEGLHGIDVVVHLAGGGGPARSIGDPVSLLRANLLGAAHLAERFPLVVFASSLYVYPPDAADATEETATRPDTLYGAVKEATEAILPGHVILRFGHVYGASAVPRDDVVTRFVRAAAFKQPIPRYGLGRRTLNLVHVRDVCDAIERAVTIEPGIYNIGGGSPTTVGQVAALVSELSGIPVEACPGPGDDSARRSLSIDKARRVLGWAPTTSLSDGLREMLALPPERLRAPAP